MSLASAFFVAVASDLHTAYLPSTMSTTIQHCSSLAHALSDRAHTRVQALGREMGTWGS